MMKIILDWLNKPTVKAVINVIFTLVIGFLSSGLDIYNIKANTFGWSVWLVVVILYIILIVHYSTMETNERKVAFLYETQNKAFEELMSGLMTTCKSSYSGANKVIKSIINEKKANLELWSFDQACAWVCQNVYKLLCKVGSGRDFEVIYDRLDESVGAEKIIYANAYANKASERPTVYFQKRNYEEDTFHDAELFKMNQSNTEVIIGSEEIDKVFGHKSKDKRNRNKKKYNQYIAIPVFCNDIKMVGLIEIVCMNQTQLGETEEDIREKISKYLMIYVFFMLLLHKLEKALVAQPR